LELFNYLFAFLFGAAIGSFLNVLIIRLPQGKSVVYPASHCPKCGNSLKWYHNIPILSWLFLGGKCAYCKEPISPQYPIVEFVSGLLFVCAYHKLGFSPYALFIALSFVLLLALSVIDLRYKAVPDSINLLAFLLALFSSSNYLENIQNALLLAGGFAMLRFFVSYYVSKKEELRLKKELARAPWLASYYPKYVMIEAMGEGDIIVAGTMGAILGVKLTFIAIFIAALVALPASLLNRRFFGDRELPFIPFLAIGLYTTFCFSQYLTKFVGF
jgi:leader peptidase (prepilin peptidase)/N-methyltransferase